MTTPQTPEEIFEALPRCHSGHRYVSGLDIERIVKQATQAAEERCKFWVCLKCGSTKIRGFVTPTDCGDEHDAACDDCGASDVMDGREAAVELFERTLAAEKRAAEAERIVQIMTSSDPCFKCGAGVSPECYGCIAKKANEERDSLAAQLAETKALMNKLDAEQEDTEIVMRKQIDSLSALVAAKDGALNYLHDTLMHDSDKPAEIDKAMRKASDAIELDAPSALARHDAEIWESAFKALCEYCAMDWPCDGDGLGWYHRVPPDFEPTVMRNEKCQAANLRARAVPPAGRVQKACDKCTQGVMDSTNDHMRGICACECHECR